jgi:hypothetical protein
VGVAVGVLVALPIQVSGLATIVSNQPSVVRNTGLHFLLGSRHVISALLRVLPNALGNAMTATFLFVMLLALLRRRWLAVSAALVVFTAVVMLEIGDDRFLWRAAIALMFVAPVMATLLRFGVLSQITALLVHQSLLTIPVTLDLTKPYAGTGAWFALTIIGLAAFGFRSSLAGRRFLGRLHESLITDD